MLGLLRLRVRHLGGLATGAAMTDREAHTPRLTATWALHEQHAAHLSERLRAYARIELDAVRGRRLRALADVATEYGRAFLRWSTEDVDAGVKLRERGAFSQLSQTIDAELALPGERPRIDRLLSMIDAALDGDMGPLRQWNEQGRL